MSQDLSNISKSRLFSITIKDISISPQYRKIERPVRLELLATSRVQVGE